MNSIGVERGSECEIAPSLQVRIGDRVRPLIHVLLEAAGMKLEAGQEIRHVCGNKECVNLKHLKIVTIYETDELAGRLKQQGVRRDFCDKGHRMDGRCLICERARKKAYRMRVREKTKMRDGRWDVIGVEELSRWLKIGYVGVGIEFGVSEATVRAKAKELGCKLERTRRGGDGAEK